MTKTFPPVSGKNLERKKFNLPQDFPARYTVVLMAFYRHQQLDIDTWLPFAQGLERKYSDLAYFELPVVYQMGMLRQFLLNEGMRAGIPDEKARRTTITLYLDKADFLGQLGIETQEEVQILLVTREGEVLWHQSGIFSQEKGASLDQFLADLFSTDAA